MRQTGIPVVGKVRWGTHFCQFYETDRDLLDTLVPYFREGLLSNEFCLWVTSAPLKVAQAKKALRAVVPDLDARIKKGQIEILDSTGWYTKTGTFDAGDVLKDWSDKLAEARRNGFEGLRLTGNTFWLEPGDWDDFTRYEEMVNEVIGSQRMIALCTYSLVKCGAKEIIDVIENHEFALIKRDGEWQILENTTRKKIDAAVHDSELRYRTLFQSMNEGVALHQIISDAEGNPIDYKITEVNLAFERHTGIPAERAVEALASELYGVSPPPFLDEYARVAATGTPVSFTRFFPPLNRQFAISCTSARQGWFSTVFSDITEQEQVKDDLARKNIDLQRVHEEQRVIEEELRHTNDELLQHESMLRETGQYLDNLITYANAPIIVWDPEFRITRFNHAFERLTGRTAASVLGRSLEILFPVSSRTASMNLIRRTKMGERWEAVEIPILHVSGEVRTVLWNSATLYKSDGQTVLSTIAQGQDITERKRAERALSQTNAELITLNEDLAEKEEVLRQNLKDLGKSERGLRETSLYLDNLITYANAPIIVWDPEFRITRFNHAFERLTGRHAPSVIGKSLDILFPESSRSASMDLIQRTQAGERWEAVEIPILHVSGEVRTVLWNSATLFKPDDQTVLSTIAQGQDITERKKTAMALAITNERLILAQDSAGAGIWDWDIAEGALTWSPELYRIYGLDPTRTATFDLWRSILHPEDARIAEEKIDDAIRDHAPLSSEYRIIVPGGGLRWIQALGKTIYDESGRPLRMSGICIDITERKNFEVAIRTSEQKFRALHDTMVQGVVYQDSEGIYISMNPAAERILGKSPGELLGRTPLDEESHTVHEDGSRFPESKHPAMVALSTGKEVQNVIMGVYNPREAGYRWINVQSAMPLFHPGEALPYQVYTLFEDITDRRKAEETLKNYAESLKRSNKELEQFAYVASHDLREPLRMVTVFSQLLAKNYKGRLDEDADEFIHYIVEGGTRMGALIDDLLEFSRVSSKAKPFEETDMNGVLTEVVTNLALQIAENDASIDIAELPVIWADRWQMIQVFQNLIGNSLKYRSDLPPRVRVSVAGGEREWVFSVSDNGIGIDPAFNEQIFEIFKRLHNRDKYPGTGIGLSIVRKIVERHGGKIWVEPKSEAGATFAFTIPKEPVTITEPSIL